jgi:hypothetical protein
MKACGMNITSEAQFQESGFIVTPGPPTDAAQAVAKFQSAGVTTVLYLGGSEGKFSQAAADAKYYPEIVLAGDLENDSNWSGRLQNQEVWQNVWGTSLQLRIDNPENAPGWVAMHEANPNANPEDSRFANEMYRDHFMLFSAIQVAGPDLTPEAIDQGFHAIPKKKTSASPYITACYFDPADYTCSKDATEFWWDPSGISPDGGLAGCIRLVRGGRRYQPGEWPHMDEAFGDRSAQPCSAWESRYQLYI